MMASTTGTAEIARDRGLVREIGTWSFAATIVNGVIGGGIFVVPAALAGAVRS